MTALLLVDLQNDFMPNGALAVLEGELILPVIRKLLEMPFDKIIASRDWHPPGHSSFSIWPEHCIQNTKGAEFHSGFDTKKVDIVISKGMDPDKEGYSAFEGTGLFKYLKEQRIHTIYIAGLATDYCVKHSAFDAVELGFKTYVVTNGCRGVDINPDDSKHAFDAMQKAGIQFFEVKND